MIIILEGADGTGKTTLMRQLLERFPRARILHQGPYHKEPLTETLEAISIVYDDPDDLTICDRLHLGERIYGPVHRGVDLLGDAKQRMLERALMGLGPVVQVICEPPLDLVRETWLSRREDELLDSVEKLEVIYRLYKAPLPTMLPTIRYDWTSTSLDELVTACYASSSPHNLGPGIGWWDSSSVLIVGERVNVNKPGPLLPFVGVGGSNTWLAEQLNGIDERWLYWVNARRPEGGDENPRFIGDLRPKGIIALGAVAANWLRLAGYHEAYRIDHPQYHKRFFHDRPYPLAQVIDELRG